MKTCYDKQPPRVDLSSLSGILIVIEGPDSVGRTAQINLIAPWLEEKGYAVVQTGLSRSKLAGRSLQRAKQGTVLSRRTMSLYYATDFYDQLENRIIPALRSGFIVLADRYIYTLIVRDLVRGTDRAWVEKLYSMALVPEAVFYLDAPPRTLMERSLARYEHLNYWEAGMDLGFSGDWYDSFLRYQKRLRGEFLKLGEEYGFQQVNARRGTQSVFLDLKNRIEEVIAGSFFLLTGMRIPVKKPRERIHRAEERRSRVSSFGGPGSLHVTDDSRNAIDSIARNYHSTLEKSR